MENNDLEEIKTEKEVILRKRGSILRPDLHQQISELLDQDYKISADQVVSNIDRISFEKIERLPKPSMFAQDSLESLEHKQFSDCEIQTDLTFKDIRVRGDIVPVQSEIEILGFYYMTEEERLEQLRILLTDDDDNIVVTDYDPCLEIGEYNRDGAVSRSRSPSQSKTNSRSSSKSRENLRIEKRSVASQTFFISSKPDHHKSTQTMQEPSSTESSPSHANNIIKAKVSSTIQQNSDDENGPNRIKDKFSLKNKKESSIEYTQISEYITNYHTTKIENIHNYVNIIDNTPKNQGESKDIEKKDDKSAIKPSDVEKPVILVKEKIEELEEPKVLEPKIENQIKKPEEPKPFLEPKIEIPEFVKKPNEKKDESKIESVLKPSENLGFEDPIKKETELKEETKIQPSPRPLENLGPEKSRKRDESIGKKLVQSTLEMTSVINNKTSVSGIRPVKEKTDKFIIKIVNSKDYIPPDLAGLPLPEKDSPQESITETIKQNKESSKLLFDVLYSNKNDPKDKKPETDLTRNISAESRTNSSRSELENLSSYSIQEIGKYYAVPAKIIPKLPSDPLSKRSVPGGDSLNTSKATLTSDFDNSEYSIRALGKIFNNKIAKPAENNVENQISRAPGFSNGLNQIQTSQETVTIKEAPDNQEYSIKELVKIFKMASDSNRPSTTTTIRTSGTVSQIPKLLSSNFDKNIQQISKPILTNTNLSQAIGTSLKNNNQIPTSIGTGIAQLNLDQIVPPLTDSFKQKFNPTPIVQEKRKTIISRPKQEEIKNNYPVNQIPSMFGFSYSSAESSPSFPVRKVLTKSDNNLNSSKKSSPNLNPKKQSNLDLSDSLKKKLVVFNDMVMIDNSNKSKETLSSSSSEVSRLNSNKNFVPSKTLTKIDVNENADIIDVDFDSYEVPSFRQVIKEIEVPVEPPVVRNSSLENSKKVSFSNELIRPEIKERKSSVKSGALIIPDTKLLDLDLSEYEEELNQRYDNYQQLLLSNSRVKIHNDEVIDDLSFEDSDIEETNKTLIQNLRTKIQSKPNPEIPKSNNLSQTRNLSKSSDNVMIEKEKSQFRVFSQSPFNNSLEEVSKGKLTISTENIAVESNSNNDVFESNGIKPLGKQENNVKKFEISEIEEPKIIELTKMDKLIKSNIEKEFQKALRRVKYRKQRVPEILKLMDKANSKESKSLQEELKILLRKSRIDNELIEQYYDLIDLDKLEENFPFQQKTKFKKKKRSKSNDTDLESTSSSSFTNVKKYSKNKNLETKINKINKLCKVDFKSSNRTLESGYSSLEESLSDFKIALKKEENEKIYLKENNKLSNNYNDLIKMMNQIERNRVWANNQSKLNDLSIERVDVNALVEVDISVDNGDDETNRNRNRRRNRPIFPNENIPRGNQAPLNYGGQGLDQNNNFPTGNNFSGRSASLGTGNSSVLSNRSVESVGNTSRSLNNQNSNSNNSESNNQNEKDKKKNILGPRDQKQEKVQDQNPSLVINYVLESQLNGLNLNLFNLFEDPETNETVLINPITNESFIILADNWRESENSFYFAEEDINFDSINVYLDDMTNRRFIFDEETGKRYFLIRFDSIKSAEEINRNLLGTKVNNNNDLTAQEIAQELLKESEKIVDSEQVIRMKHSNENETTSPGSEIELNYAEEQEIKNVNLEDFAFYQDDASGETLLINRANTNQRWIILPNEWRTTENLPYIAEEDIDLINLDVYMDPPTQRKYVIDDKTGQRYYLIPKFRKDIRNFIGLNKNQNHANSANREDKTQTKPSSGEVLKSSLKKPQVENENKKDKLKTILGNEQIENLENEPSYSKLRDSQARSTTKKTRFDLDNQSKFIIKQPGKPGHLIKTNTDKNEQTNANKNQKSDAIDKSKPPKDPKSEKNKSKKQPSKADLAVMARMKQDAARRAFFAQKLPNVDKLWLHQLLIEQTNQEKRIENLRKRFNSTENLSSDSDSDNGKPKAWRSMTELNDPTVDRDSDDLSLDRRRLADVQIYGYNKFDKSKKKRNIFDEEENKHRHGKDYQPAVYPNNDSFGGFENYPYIRSILTEDFVESKDYRPVQMNRYYRALVPHTRLNLRQQFLTTPRYLKSTWQDVLSQSNRMQPKIILINDDEVILTKNRNCNVYVQFMHENDAVRGADWHYQIMLPERGPTNPARPLMISPGKLSKAMELKQDKGKKSEYGLREAPVYVYHRNGSAFFENLAQYLAGKQPQLSPKTARKILQFADLKEFEEYLASKLTRDEAKRLANMSGEGLINVDSLKRELLNINRDLAETNGEPIFFDNNCEYDPLRPVEKKGFKTEVTNEYEIGGNRMKSTFIGFDDNGEAKRVKFSDLPQNLITIMKDALKSSNSTVEV